MKLTTYIVQPSGGGCSYSFTDPASDTITPSNETTTANGRDRFDWSCVVAGQWSALQFSNV